MKKGIQAKLWDGKQFRNGWLTYSKGVIERVSFNRPSPSRAATLHNLKDKCMLPGFVDTLLHGFAGVDCGAGTPARLHKMTVKLARTGVTTTLAGLYPATNKQLIQAAKNWDKWASIKGARTRVAGWHVEGPFVSREMSGALPKTGMRKPSIKAAQQFIDACGGWLMMTTLAPELDGALEASEVLRRNNVIPSVGHSRATALQCEMLRANGKIAVTHLGNRMLPMTARELGPIGLAMCGGIDYVAVIPDMVHVSADTLSMWANTAKLKSRLMACSDNLSHAGTRAKKFQSGGQTLSRSGAVAINSQGNLGGTLDPLPELLLRAHRDGALSLQQVVSMGCQVAGDMLGDCGRLKAGRRADFVEYNESKKNIGQVWCKGRKV
jgi:N-acetylglucosamine-6-phosphate deacetylase